MRAQINGYDVFYTIEGQGRPMLLMHGGTGLDHTQFHPWLDALGTTVQLIYIEEHDAFVNVVAEWISRLA